MNLRRRQPAGADFRGVFSSNPALRAVLLTDLLVLGLLAVPRLREFLTLGHDDIADWYRRQYPAVFR